MDITTILIIIGAGLAALIILAIVVSSVRKKNRINKLDESIKKFKEEANKSDVDTRLTIASDVAQPITEEDLITEKQEEKLEDDFFEEEHTPKRRPIVEDFSDLDIFNFNDDDDEKKVSKSNKKDDDFEDFLDQHSYTRKIVNKDLLKKFNKLPPETKSIILGNVFNKFDD